MGESSQVLASSWEWPQNAPCVPGRGHVENKELRHRQGSNVDTDHFTWLDQTVGKLGKM